MNKIISKIISIVNFLLIKYYNKKLTILRSRLFLVIVKLSNGSRLSILETRINKSHFFINGDNNEAIINGEHLTNCTINIFGINNKLIIDKGVGISNGIITIRGNNCLVRIGENTTIGGIRIVNVGSNNSIEIGKNCMFSDNIEIWASDTHSIYDAKGVMINKEQPVIIEDNVWIGSHVSILKGVKIEHGAIIGMASVVTKSLKPYSVNVGNPARCIKSDIKWSLEYNMD